MDSLQTKLQKVEEEHFEHVEGGLVEEFNQALRDEAFEFRGSVRAVTSINRTLTSSLIAGLMKIEERKYWKAWGYKSFADYLASDEVTEFSKSKYYDLKKLLETEGPERFDFLEGKRIPLSTRKQLAANNVEIEIDGDVVRIGEYQAPTSDRQTILEICDAYNEGFRELRAQNEKLTEKVDAQKEQLDRGREEYEQLQRNYDALKEDGPFAKALMKYLGAAQNLIAEIKNLPEADRAARGRDDVKIFTQQWFLLRDAYGLRISLSDDMEALKKRVKAMKPVDEMTDEERHETLADRAIAALDDEGAFDDLD